MKKCHTRSLEVLKTLLGPMTHRSLFRALDVAGGDGRLSKSFLVEQYLTVDHFDQCPTAVTKAREALLRHARFGYSKQSTMQDFDWQFEYSGIFLVWVAGYLGDTALVNFLRKAKTKLIPGRFRTTRQEKPESFIIVLDNIIEVDADAALVKSQRLRTEAKLEALFEQVGLLIHRKTDREAMPGDHCDVVAWALY